MKQLTALFLLSARFSQHFKKNYQVFYNKNYIIEYTKILHFIISEIRKPEVALKPLRTSTPIPSQIWGSSLYFQSDNAFTDNSVYLAKTSGISSQEN